MAVSLQSLKISSEKVEEIDSTLESLDRAVELISAFTQTEQNQELLEKLLDNIDDVKTIVESVDLMETTTEDINKGTYLGNRKIDIDIAINKQGITDDTPVDEAFAIWSDTTNTVYYDKATATFDDGVVIEVPFVNVDAQPIEVSTTGAIVDQLNDNTDFNDKFVDGAVLEEVGGKIGTIVRIIDITGRSANLERIQLHASVGAYTVQEPIYYWAKTTSALQTLANRVADIITLGNDIDNLIILANRIDELVQLQNNLPQLVGVAGDDTIYNHLAELLGVYSDLVKIVAVSDDLTNIEAVFDALANINSVVTDIIPNLTTILDTKNQADIAVAAKEASDVIKAYLDELKLDVEALAQTATEQAQIATDKNAEIKAISVANTTTGAAGTLANVVYDSLNNAFTFIVPQGIKGDKGDNFEVNAVGLIADRSLYDDKLTGFSFLALDEASIYFKLSDTSGDWSDAAPFGKGDTGDTGETGVGISSITFTSTTDASGEPAKSGATDTYTITWTDTTTTTFNVYNGLDSAVLSVNGETGDVVIDVPISSVAGRTGDVVLTNSDVGLGNVDNTSDLDKPISTATQTELDTKQDTLVSGTNIKTIDGISLLGSEDISVSAGFKSMQVFTASGTWTKPAGITKIKVTAVGGGGGGGGVFESGTNDSSAGGGGGGTAISVIDVTAITSETVTIGAAGTNTNAGGDSSFGTTVIGYGGGGAPAGTTVVDAGGVGGSGIGDIVINGSDGLPSAYNSAVDQVNTCNGGMSLFSTMSFGASDTTSNGGVSVDSKGYGGGESGVLTGDNSIGAGTQGIVIIEEYA